MIDRTLEWFRIAKPISSLTPADFSTQIGVHFEEVGEMIDVISTKNVETGTLLDAAYTALNNLAEHLKKSGDVIFVHPAHRIDYIDALCDQIVTAVGCAHQENMDIAGALNEVNHSNFSKFVDGKAIYDENRKIAKGPEYLKANLTTYV